ncbi:class I adenylate-forming enzyme family protein [Caldimonas sp.]|uniref:class I adenylate-forming enzyme family protein n=1 Tax=Caldimonas sp. TaxID=2838790 RepID=UPI003919F65F
MGAFALSSTDLFTPGAAEDLQPQRLHHWLDHWAQRQSDAPALQDERAALSYGALAAAVEAAAQGLREAGVQPGDRVLVVGENCNAAAILVLACSRLDAWVSLVNARLSEREIDTFLEHSQARVVVGLGEASAEALRHLQRLGGRSQRWPGAGEVLLAAGHPQASPEPVSEAADAQVAALIYTSGTSGAPKGVMLTHANLLFIAANSRRQRRLTSADRVYGVLPLSHVYGLTAVLLATLSAGASLVLAARFAPEAMARALADERITVLHGVPAMYAKLLEWGDRPGNTLRASALRVAQSGGAPLDQALKDRFEQHFGLPLHNGYGMTEASPSICQTRLDAPRRDCSVGPPIPGIEVQVVDLESRRPVPVGETGELWLRGPNVMKGYYRNPALTAETVDTDGWLHTGDLARMEADGTLSIVGRSKELIIRSGFNVYPVEVEDVLNAHPDVVLSAVVGRPVPGNEEVVAFVEPVPGRTLDTEALMAWLRERLSPYKLPAQIVVMPQLPASATGKLYKQRLREQALQLSSSKEA